MDPISQGALGAALPLSVQNRLGIAEQEARDNRNKAATVAWVGGLAGMSPDLDVLIRSSTDPLLFLEFHRQFTHSLFFIPIGALICAAVFYRWSRRDLDFKQTYLVCFLGYATHALLDACTSYGTQLLWPFTNHRFAWNNIAVVDPFATLPLLTLIIIAVRRRSLMFARLGLLWFLFYLSMGFVQQYRAEQVASALAASRGHDQADISIKAGFANILLWKSIYELDSIYYVDAIRVGASTSVYPGTSVAKLDVERDLPWLDPTTQQGVDLERFRWFSKDYLAMDPNKENIVIDMRYSILPNEVNPLWGIALEPSAPSDQHVAFLADRDVSQPRRAMFLAMLRGDACIQQSSDGDSSKSICALKL